MAHDRIYALSVPWKGGRAREQTLYARLPLPALSPPYQKSTSSMRGSRNATQSTQVQIFTAVVPEDLLEGYLDLPFR